MGEFGQGSKSNKVNLKDGPGSFLPQNGAGGQFGYQSTSATVQLSQTPSNKKFGQGTPDGTRVDVGGTKVQMSDKPYTGWQSQNTPMSERDSAQKKIY